MNDDGDNIYIYGHGTISGDKFPHPSQEDPPAVGWTHSPIFIQGIKPLFFQNKYIHSRLPFNNENINLPH